MERHNEKCESIVRMEEWRCNVDSRLNKHDECIADQQASFTNLYKMAVVQLLGMLLTLIGIMFK